MWFYYFFFPQNYSHLRQFSAAGQWKAKNPLGCSSHWKKNTFSKDPGEEISVGEVELVGAEARAASPALSQGLALAN